jgi:hypothetical protein
MISQREATFRLSTTARPPLTPRLAEGVLVSGFAGRPIRLGTVSLYDEAVVRRVAAAGTVDPHALPEACRPGMLVVRTTARPHLLELPEAERMQQACGAFWFSPSVRLHLSILLERRGFVCVVATVASYVLATADVTEATLDVQEGRALTRLTHAPPGTWAAEFRGQRLVTPPGNRWLWLTPRPQPVCEAS